MELLLFLSCFVLSVNSVAIQGRMYTRYNPCSLGIIYFDKFTNITWKGTINFSLYPNITDAEVEVNFDKPMRIFGASHNSTVYVRKNWHSFLFKPRDVLPPRYVFYIAVANVSDVPNVTQVKLNNYTLCDETVKNKLNSQSYNATQSDDTTYTQVCGRRELRNAELTSVKTDAKAGDWPWHVAILIRQNISMYALYQCGGNIVSRTAVLTAGHCVFYNSLPIQISQLIIEAGVNNLRAFDQPGRQILPALDVIVNPGYKSAESTADLAIIRVNAFRYTEFVQPICLWGPSYDKRTLYGQMAMVVGFGTTEENHLSDSLRSTYTVVQNDTTCISYSPQLYTSLLNEFTFCAGLHPNAGTSPLQGDSGGGLSIPMVQPDHKVSWFLRGILSKCGIAFGQTLCNPKYYIIYTDVGPHYGWIYHNAGLNYLSNVVN